MNYNDIITCINNLSNRQQNIIYLEQLENANISEGIIEMVIPKIIDLIKLRTNKLIKDIISNLEIMFNDINMLDYELVKVKKEITFINRLISIKHLPLNIKNNLKQTLKDDITNMYNILKKEANTIDNTGYYELIIKNNEYKWREEHEL